MSNSKTLIRNPARIPRANSAARTTSSRGRMIGPRTTSNRRRIRANHRRTSRIRHRPIRIRIQTISRAAANRNPAASNRVNRRKRASIAIAANSSSKAADKERTAIIRNSNRRQTGKASGTIRETAAIRRPKIAPASETRTAESEAAMIQASRRTISPCPPTAATTAAG